jgi:hypothetical protein
MVDVKIDEQGLASPNEDAPPTSGAVPKFPKESSLQSSGIAVAICQISAPSET